MTTPLLEIKNQQDLSGSIFWLVYIVAIIMSVVGVFITSKLRHDREVEKFRKKVLIARTDPSSAWPFQEEEE